MDNCYFCASIQKRAGLEFITELETELFVAVWDINPVTPGHMLIIPKRHAQYMKELGNDEQTNLIEAAVAAKVYIEGADLKSIYGAIFPRVAGTKSGDFIELALTKLERTNRSPDAFNDGLNDGPAAGQTVPHFHWHVMPRWEGDAADPRGGIRHMFAGMGNYHEGMAKQE
jgi:diadenosine tetraphosphate (Ap4A) HIT family hydrolase